MGEKSKYALSELARKAKRSIEISMSKASEFGLYLEIAVDQHAGRY